LIEAKDVVYEYFRRDEEGNVTEINRALDGVTLDIKQGEFIAILGANGSGKSTFAKHLNALLTPSEGTLIIDGKNTNDLEALWKIRQTTGMVFQNPDNQIIANVVEEDVGFGPENIGVPTEEIWERVNASLDAVGMSKFRKHSPNALSGGQKQRVAIAGVMAMKTKCIVLDESTAMLDPSGRKEVMETVMRLNKEEGITVILITHHMDEVVNADRVYVMYQGQVQMEGTPRALFSQVEQLKEYRLDVPQVTKLAYELRKEGMDLPESILTVDELVQALLDYKACR
jgi:energy-coupling factor transporter ATPase